MGKGDNKWPIRKLKQIILIMQRNEVEKQERFFFTSHEIGRDLKDCK